MFKKVTLASVILLPSAIEVLIYEKVFYWEIEKIVTVGLSHLERKVVTQDNVRIGNFNIFRRPKLLDISRNSYIRSPNRLFSDSYGKSKTIQNKSVF